MGPSYRVSETGLPQSIRLSAIFKASKVDGTYMSFSMALMHECIVDELIRNHGTHGSCTVCELFGHIQDVGNYSSRPAHAFFWGATLKIRVTRRLIGTQAEVVLPESKFG